MKLFHESGREIHIGDKVYTFRLELVTVTGFDERRVYCRDSEGRDCAWFHSVIDAYVSNNS